MSGSETGGQAAWLRYALFQIPGLALTGVVLYAAVTWAGLPAKVAWLLLVAWVTKDVVMYRAIRVAYQPGPPDGSAALIGATGIALVPLAPNGWIKVGAERWRARVPAEAPHLPEASRVRVSAADGFTLIVDAVEATSVDPASGASVHRPSS